MKGLFLLVILVNMFIVFELSYSTTSVLVQCLSELWRWKIGTLVATNTEDVPPSAFSKL